jgi:hypothetical protein
VQVHYGEGVAFHTGPEPCVVAREDGSEASAGERIGQPLSRESAKVSGADAVSDAGRHDRARQRECPDNPARSKTLACADAPCSGTERSYG